MVKIQSQGEHIMFLQIGAIPTLDWDKQTKLSYEFKIFIRKNPKPGVKCT